MPFVPSRHGLGFDNAWPPAPAVTVATAFGEIRLGAADGGLCGGMVFAALDYYHAGVPAPVARPGPRTPLYEFIVRRLLDSWQAPGGVARYYEWMGLPDGDGTSVQLFGRPLLTRRGLSWRTICGEWPRIRLDLDRGVPVPLGVITVASRQPRELASNHQVLAYGYRTAGPRASLRVYDPNRGRRDDVAITFDTSTPAAPTPFGHNLAIGGRRVRGFFRTGYRPHRSPPR
jgi:hypothetical protein